MSQGKYPLLSYRFSIQMVGLSSLAVSGYFMELSGLKAEQEIIEYKVYHPITRHDQIVLIPGRRNSGEVTLKQGVTDDLGFWTWRWFSVHGSSKMARSSIAITMYSPEGEPTSIWYMMGAYPTRVSGPEMKADSNDIAVEELTIKYTSLTRLPFIEIMGLSLL